MLIHFSSSTHSFSKAQWMSIVGMKCGMECVDKMGCVWTEMNDGFERSCGRNKFCTLKTSLVSNSLFFPLLVHISRIQQYNEWALWFVYFLLFYFSYTAHIIQYFRFIQSNNESFLSIVSLSLSLVPRFCYERKLVSWVFQGQVKMHSTHPCEASKGLTCIVSANSFLF